MTEDVKILEEPEPVERSCSNCGVRYASGKQSVIEGNAKAQRDRMPICMPCDHNPNMGTARAFASAMLGKLGKADEVDKLFGKGVDNWRPITDDDKSCQTCKVQRTVNALGPCEEAALIVSKKCLLCKFSKNADMIRQAHANAGIEKELEDNWQDFEK